MQIVTFGFSDFFHHSKTVTVNSKNFKFLKRNWTDLGIKYLKFSNIRKRKHLNVSFNFMKIYNTYL